MELDFETDPSVLGTIVDAMAVGVFTVDVQARFVAWSQGAERITGYQREEVVGKPCHLLEGPNCKGFAALAELLAAAEPAAAGVCDQQCRVMSRAGREIHIQGSVRVLTDASGKVAGAVGTFMDVTSLIQANEKIALLEEQTRTRDHFEQLIGKSTAMQEVFRRLKLAADSDVTVLITGASGTGKELAAKAIHAHSARSKSPFLAINCSAIPESLLESELFGHVQGAFTGATADKMGMFEAASGGTLFLDEIGDISPAVQVKLLRVLQEREVRRIGASQNQSVDVRLITATHQKLQDLVAAGKIREDFYYRIHVFEIHMPALYERPDDIPLLVDQFVREICEKSGRGVNGIAKDALQLLIDYHWPGNVRQLRNAIEHACVIVTGDRISYLDLPLEIRDPHGMVPDVDSDFSEPELAERQRIIDALRHTGGNRTKAAELLGTSRVTLWKKINRYAIEVPFE